tara:strand:- start:24 stop:830 length:807 start_codon:yes stop_codon:yes gene_type:complete
LTRNSILVTGATSFLAGHFLRCIGDDAAITATRRVDPSIVARGGFDVVVNFSYDRALADQPYDPERDPDRILAEAIAPLPTHFFMLSSRTVYGRGDGSRYKEDAALAPATPYARNKAETEAFVRHCLGDRATILRLSNIFGMEAGRHTFAGRALATLKKERRINLDISADSARDFLPVETFALVLAKLLTIRPGMTLNVGSGIPVPIGDMARWFIQGFGEGEIIAESNARFDEFSLDIGGLESFIGPVTTREAIKAAAQAAGRELKNA